jgi:hypothetical protein
VGEENFIWPIDFPHCKPTWPKFGEIIVCDLDTLPADVRAKLVRERVTKLHNIPIPRPVQKLKMHLGTGSPKRAGTNPILQQIAFAPPEPCPTETRPDTGNRVSGGQTASQCFQRQVDRFSRNSYYGQYGEMACHR